MTDQPIRSGGDDAAVRREQTKASSERDLSGDYNREANSGRRHGVRLDRRTCPACRPEQKGADHRHRADIARLETEAAVHRANIVQEETEATEGGDSTRHAPSSAEAQAIQMLAVELDRVRADADRTLAAELAAAEERSRADVLRVRADTQRALAEESGAVTNYYDLWQARFEGVDVPAVVATETPHPHVGRQRRRRALAAAAILVVLLTISLGTDSALRVGLAVAASSAIQVIGRAGPLDQAGALTAPRTELAIDGTARNDVSSGTPLSQVALEAIGFLVVLLLLRVALFVGDGLVWHGLVVTLGIVLLGFVVMRAPWPAESVAGPTTSTSERDVGTPIGDDDQTLAQ